MQNRSAVNVESNVTKVKTKIEVDCEIESKEGSQVDAAVIETLVKVTSTSKNQAGTELYQAQFKLGLA